MNSVILGISAYYHDSAAALLIDGEIIAAAQEERFTRKKHDPGFPTHAIQYCLEESGLDPGDIQYICFYEKPLLKFERLLETYHAFAPRGLRSFIASMQVWLKEKLFLKEEIKRQLKDLGGYSPKNTKLLFSEHHLSHAASAYFPSPFEEAAILTIDGVGEWATATISRGVGNQIHPIKELRFPHSPGLLYSSFTYFLGFKVNSGEYKLMGLAPYGNPNSEQTTSFQQIIKNRLVKIFEDGSIWMDQSYYQYCTGLRMIREKKWQQLFNMEKRAPESPISQHHCNLALAIQLVIEEIVLKMARTACELAKSSNLCLAGGVALNCVANGKLQNEPFLKNLFVQPASGDAGGALGAALSLHHQVLGRPRITKAGADSLKGSYLGPSFSNAFIQKFARKVNAPCHTYSNRKKLCREVAHHLSQGSVVGWFQGRMEFGPRALGNRSILGDPSNPGMQEKINRKIKFRESFRPFAPAVLKEEVHRYFDLSLPSPYMLLAVPVMEEHRKAIPENYWELGLMDRLSAERSDLQACTHVDFSARIQTVDREINPEFHELLLAFKEEKRFGVLVNTSFNVRGEPIVCSPMDAYSCFMSTDMDILVMENCIFYKPDQPHQAFR